MNDFNLSSLTPKRIVLGVVVLILFIIFYSGFRIALAPSSLGLSGNSTTAQAPQVGYALGMPSATGAYVSRDSQMKMAAYDSSGEMAYNGTDVALAPMPIPSSPPSGESKIVKNGNLSLLVGNVDDTATKINAIRADFGGQPGNASFNEYRPGMRSGSMTIWVPSEHFDEAMIAIKKLALRIENENVSVQDVSAQYVDLESRLKNLKSSEAQYLEILKRSGKISEVLDVTREINNTRAQIEQTQGQLDYLSHQVALSSISVNLSQEAVPTAVTDEWRPFTVIKEAAKETLTDLTNFISMLLVFLVKLPVLLLNIGFWLLILFGLWKAGCVIYRRLKNSTHAV